MIDWDDNAIEAVKAYCWWIGSDDNCGLEVYELLDKFIKEVETRKAVKTVADVVEKDGEKWTHVYTDDTGTDIRCRILAEHGEWAWVEDAGTVGTINRSCLKPIKPTLSKSEAWDLCQDYDGHKNMKAYMYDLHEEYDII